MTALEDILAKYSKDEVDAILPVVFLAGAAAPVDQITPKLNQKITQAMQIMGVSKATNPEEVALAIARYCVEKRVNAAILTEIASTYQQAQTQRILTEAAAHVDVAVKAAGGTLVKNAPKAKDAEKARPQNVKAKRGLKKS